ncbi:MAG: hypothetical protein V4708_04055 [Bacteroidota bacterium]
MSLKLNSKIHIGKFLCKEYIMDYRAKDFVSYYANKSVTNGVTYITLIRKDFLEKIKELGGDFNREGNEFFFSSPTAGYDPIY